MDTWEFIPNSNGFSEDGSTEVDSPADDGPTLDKTTLNAKISKVSGELSNSQPLNNVSFDRHKIKFSVFLYHNGDKYDMSPHILQVKTHMAMGEASGRFTLLLNFKKRWDKLIHAMDYVEISFSRYLAEAPIMMRGFVGNIRRTRLIDGSGKLHRAFTVNGENFGKIWSNYYIEYLVQQIGQQLQGLDVNATMFNPQLLANMLTENYGILSSDAYGGSIGTGDLIQGFLDKMLNPYLDVLKQTNPMIPNLIPQINVLHDYQIVNGSLIQQVQEQSVFQVLGQFGNRPWCEYYIDDFSNGPVLFFRNTPFKDEKGDLIFPESNPTSEYYSHPEINDTHVIEEDVGKSDNEVYSYFFTYPAVSPFAQVDARAAILGNTDLTIEQESDTSNISNPHVELENLYRYGFKSLTIPSNSIPLEASDTDLSMSTLIVAQKMNRWLTKAFRWSADMKNGTMKVKGNEHLRIGRYFTQTSTQEEYYIESVDHEITISQIGSTGNDSSYRFETTIGVTRGRDL